MISLADLLETPTEDEIAAQLVDYLSGLGFAAQSWQEGSWQLHIVHLSARVAGMGAAASVSAIAASGFIRLAASEAWTELVGQEVYDRERNPATETQGEMVLTSSAGAPAHTITEEVLIADGPTAPANTYRVVAGTSESLSPGGTVTVDVVAEVAGTEGNIASGSTLYLWTPLVGVTATNPTIAGSPSWITTKGTDKEDLDRYRTRARGRWDTLSYAAGDGAYRVWTLEADASVVDVKVYADNPLGPGTVRIVCKTATGGISGAQITAITDYIYGTTDGVGRRPLNDIVTVDSATLAGRAFEVTVKVQSAYQAVTTSAVIEQVFVDYCADMPIGGHVVPPIAAGRIIESDLVGLLDALPGVVEVEFDSLPLLTIGPDDYVEPFVVVHVELV